MDQGLDSSDELARALGTLVINFSFLEESLRDAIQVTAGGNSGVVSVLTAGLHFKTLLEKFGLLCKEAPSLRVPKADVEAYCNALGSLTDERNAMVRSAYLFQRGKEPTCRSRPSGTGVAGVALPVAEFSPKDILRLATQLRSAEQRLWELVA